MYNYICAPAQRLDSSNIPGHNWKCYNSTHFLTSRGSRRDSEGVFDLDSHACSAWPLLSETRRRLRVFSVCFQNTRWSSCFSSSCQVLRSLRVPAEVHGSLKRNENARQRPCRVKLGIREEGGEWPFEVYPPTVAPRQRRTRVLSSEPST